MADVLFVKEKQVAELSEKVKKLRKFLRNVSFATCPDLTPVSHLKNYWHLIDPERYKEGFKYPEDSELTQTPNTDKGSN